MKSTAYDLLVVGTGFASTFFLKQYLSKAPATARVLVLERGHLYPRAERVKEILGQETAYAKLNPLANDTFENHNRGKDWHFSVGFGGSSNCWYGCTPRFLPSDFRMKTLYGIGNDWPVQYDELDPYYEQVEDLMAISGPAETPYPRKKAYAQPPHLFTAVDTLLHRQYGKLYISQPTARARVATHGRNPCCASAVCSVCPVDAKFTIENSNFRVYDDPRVELLHGAQVYGLELVQDRVRKVSFHRNAQDQHVGAEVVALGANALFNANILLNSGDKNPFTGRGLGEQLGLQAHVYLDNLQSLGGSTWVNANGYMLYDGEHRKEYAACLMESSNAPFFRPESGKWRNMASFRMIFEDLPDADNYVATTADIMKPAIHFKGPSDYTRKAIERMKQRLPAVLACLPVEQIIYDQPYASEAHILGTTRMSVSAAQGVVDKHLRHHQYRNLFVLGSGSFTTYTPANPTLTLSALSLLAADQSF
ncbi:GMC family oxidoreductase [Hymenobacter sp. BT683]|uniref:GMC family oxidoreductase n=1 Tax=Hymenobacter jeongseonensis TaxID=2791027 RepID=A0ABS0IDS9_9BACT|nr:GMC family oxidoreductase [Hymenobacter jeongseonensis]MBF9236506.1 GMC family oxidoreductase [Hymenobacter jeongseonensis]